VALVDSGKNGAGALSPFLHTKPERAGQPFGETQAEEEAASDGRR
jgi:hypothetical protein